MRVEFKSIGGEAAAPSAPPRTRGCGARLVEALVTLADGHGILTEHRQRPWASVTFSGTRHELVLEFAGMEALAGAESLIAALPEHEFSIPRQMVADAVVVAVDQLFIPAPRMIVRCEVLMLDDV